MHTGDAAMSIVTYMELIYGAYKSQRVDANLAALHELATLIPVLPLEMSNASRFNRTAVT